MYPARFRRVLAACGVMFGDKPYADLPDARMMAGSYGPSSKMDTAMAAYTPNTAWARYACVKLIDFDGAGTSAATPQIAAAAACWLQKHFADLPAKGWERIESVRQALYGPRSNTTDREHFGRGLLRASDALSLRPADVKARIKQQEKDKIDVPLFEGIFKVIFGAVAPDPSQQQMLRVEAAQILARSGELQNMLAEAGVDPDDPGEVSAGVRQKALDALASHSSASKTLRQAVGSSLSTAKPSWLFRVCLRKSCPPHGRSRPSSRIRSAANFACSRSIRRSGWRRVPSPSTRPRSCHVGRESAARAGRRVS